MIRLCLSWSALEPMPGNYSEMYLQRVEQVLSSLHLNLIEIDCFFVDCRVGSGTTDIRYTGYA